MPKNRFIMIELKPVEITLKILQKINEEDTGSWDDFATYLGISPAWVTKYIRKIEQELKLEICYNRKRNTYYRNTDSEIVNTVLI